MAISAQQVIDRVRHLVSDVGSVRWLDTELLLWISDGRRELAAFQPGLFAQTSNITHALAAGSYQLLATNNAFAITAVTHNIGVDGALGDAIRFAAQDDLDLFNAGWRADTGARVQNWTPDTLNPVAFWVYPAVAGGKVQVVVRVTPPELTAVSDTALPFDQFLSPLVNYVLHRAYAKDAEVAQNATLSAAYLQLFSAAVSAKE